MFKTTTKKKQQTPFVGKKKMNASLVSDVGDALLLLFVQRLKFDFGAFGSFFALVVLLLPKPEQQETEKRQNTSR